MPGGDKKTNIIVVGNLLHEDSVMMRLKDGIEKGILNGVYREYPLILVVIVAVPTMVFFKAFPFRSEAAQLETAKLAGISQS